MFETTLKYLNLFILPNPKFTIPESEGDFIYRIKQCKADPDTSYISNLVTPAKKVLKSSPVSEARTKARTKHRHTICCGSIPTTGSGTSFFKFDNGSKCQSLLPFTSFSSDTSFLGPWEPVDSLRASSQQKIRIVTPTDSPTPSSVRRQLDRDIAYLYSPNQTRRDRTTGIFSNVFEKSVETSRKGKGKEKRNSAPPILPPPRQTEQVAIREDATSSMPSKVPSPAALIHVLPYTQLISPLEELLPAIEHKNPRERRITIPDASYTSSKLFELDLSPILEDSRTFSEPLDAKQESSSSDSSYGELLEEGMTDYYSLSYYGSFGGLEIDNDIEDQANAYMQDSTQGFGDIQDTDWQSGLFQTLEDSILIPELRLTVPTPEMGTTPEESPSKTDRNSDVLIDHRDNPLLTSMAPIRTPKNAEWPRLALSLDAGTKPAFETGSFGDFTCDNEIYESVDCSSSNPAYRSLADTAAVVRVNTPALNGPPSSGCAKNRVSGDGKLKRGLIQGRRFWNRFSVTGILDTTGSSKRSVTSAQGESETTTTGIACFVNHSVTTQSLSAEVAEAWIEKRYSGSPSLATTACIIEEGEHAASRLFGTSNTGRRRETAGTHVGEERDRVDKHINLEDADNQPRRRSFGFDLKPLDKLRRYIQSDSLVNVDPNRTTVRLRLKRFWARRQNSAN